MESDSFRDRRRTPKTRLGYQLWATSLQDQSLLTDMGPKLVTDMDQELVTDLLDPSYYPSLVTDTSINIHD